MQDQRRGPEAGGELRPGEVFAGRFRIERMLGRGGMGAVYLARHEVLQRRFAIKVLRAEVREPEILARFEREARAISRVDHPHVVSVFDFGRTGANEPYLALEYVEGETLDRTLGREGRLEVSRVLQIVGQVADALAAAHKQRVIHRDLKPSNIVLTRQRGIGVVDYAKILDFGLALVDEGRLTALGVMYGTPDYMSPEQCTDDRQIDGRTDIYSLGAVAYALLAGQPPFVGKVIDVIHAHVDRTPRTPTAASGRRDIGPTVDRLVLRCLAKRPAERPDAEALLGEIETLLARAGERTGRRTGPQGPPVGRDAEPEPLAGTLADPGERASRLLELAHALRERGIGAPVLTERAALLLEARDQLAEVDGALAALDAEARLLGQRARSRAAELRAGLRLIDLETSREVEDDPAATLPVDGGPQAGPAALIALRGSLGERLERLGLERERLEVIASQRRAHQRRRAELHRELERRQEALVAPLWPLRRQTRDKTLIALFGRAGL